MAGLLTVAIGSVSAVDIGHFFSTSFAGSGTNALTTPTSADVDNSAGPSAGAVYVTDSATHRVEKFDASGNFILMFGDEVNATTGGDVCTLASGNTCKAGNGGTSAEQLGTPTFLAVDSSASASKGDVYVADTANNTIHKYDENGNLITSWGSGGKLDGSSVTNGPFGSLAGIDVDSSGNLDVGNTNGPIRIWKFTQSGSFITTFTYADGRGTSGVGFAVSPDGHFFKANGSPTVQRANSTGGESVQITSVEGTTGINVDSSTGTLYQVRGSQISEYKFNGSGQPVNSENVACTGLSEFGSGCPATHTYGSGSLSGAKGIGVNAATNKLYVADAGNHRIAVFLPALAPKVTTGEPTANTTVSGSVDPDGAGEVVECYFEFGTSAPAYGSKQSCSPATPYNSVQAVTANLPGLVGETTYHYRLVAKNLSGAKNFGADKTITPHNVKGLKTEAATAVTRTAAKLHASFEGNGEDTHYYFEWGTSTAYGTQSATPPGTDAGSPTAPPNTALEFTATGLQPDTTYHFRVVAENGSGKSPGKDETFKTLPAVQNLVTEAATDVAPRSATLHGSYLGDGGHTTYYYEYGKTTSYGSSTTPQDAGSPSGSTSLPASLTGLELETTYHYRVVATNSLGTTKGNDQSLTTKPAVASLVTTDATEIGQDSVTLNGEFSGNGEDTHYYFEYGLTSKYGMVSEEPPGSDAGTPAGVTAVSSAITDYEAYETYHYRVVASNSLGTTYGNDHTFTALSAPLPGISSTAASGVGRTSATLEAEINPNRWLTVYAFEYGPTMAYGSSTEISGPIGPDKTMHAVNAVVNDLSPGATYHFRVVAINFTGTAYGPDQTLTTPDAPRVDLTFSAGLGESTARLGAQVNPKSSATTVHFEYGTSTAYDRSTAEVPIGSDAADHEVGADLTGLSAGTTYHFRVVASNAFGTAKGADQTFATAPARVVEPEGPKVTKCKKGFVKRHGKCVRKKHPRHGKHQRHSTRRHG